MIVDFMYIVNKMYMIVRNVNIVNISGCLKINNCICNIFKMVCWLFFYCFNEWWIRFLLFWYNVCIYIMEIFGYFYCIKNIWFLY